MLKHVKASGGSLKNLFNTSGVLYKEMKLASKIDTLKTDDAIRLLSKNGKLIKRPFLLTSDAGAVGFKEETWKEIL